MFTDLEQLCVRRETSLREAITQIDRNRLGIVLVIDDAGRLAGTVTDGDVRRAMLANPDLGQPVSVVLARKAGTKYANPITAAITSDRETWRQIMTEQNILHLPLVDDAQRVAGLTTLVEFVPHQDAPIQALIMAGGEGTRLRPLTETIPKPMLPVGDRPLMEIVIEQLRDAGITQVNIAMRHLTEKISGHFGDGQKFGVALSYVTEDRPLGTAGALGLMETPKDTLLVINGDILTQVDFRAMLAFHRDHQADLTVAVRHYDVNVPYGVVECDGSVVSRLREKPVMRFFVNAGIYLLEPGVCGLIPHGQRYDMTDLIQRVLDAGRSVVSFPIHEYWLDIGQSADYQLAQEHVKSWSLE